MRKQNKKMQVVFNGITYVTTARQEDGQKGFDELYFDIVKPYSSGIHEKTEGKKIGYELELAFGSKMDFFIFIVEIQQAKIFQDLVFMRDSSITSGEGVEIKPKAPLSFAQAKKQIQQICKALSVVQVRGHNVGGFHVTFNNIYNPKKGANILLYPYIYKNICTKVGQRQFNAYCTDIADSTATVRFVLGKLAKNDYEGIFKQLVRENGQRAAVVRSSGLAIEYRFFNSSTRADRLLARLEFCEMIVNGDAPDEDDLEKLLAKARECGYSNLTALLCGTGAEA